MQINRRRARTGQKRGRRKCAFRSSAYAIRTCALLFICAVSTGNAETPITLLPASGRPLAEENTLRVNIANDSRLVVRLTEAEGIKVIVELAQQSYLEEAWLYVPSLEIWVEIGSEECLTDHRSAVRIDVEYLERILEVQGLVKLYHFHPEEFCVPRDASGDFLNAQAQAQQARAQDVRKIGLALPSPADISLSVMLSELSLGLKDAANIDFVVVSPLGVATYGLTDEGVSSLERRKAYPFGNPQSEIVIEAIMPLGTSNIIRTLAKLSSPTIADVIGDLAAQSSSHQYRMDFQPFP